MRKIRKNINSGKLSVKSPITQDPHPKKKKKVRNTLIKEKIQQESL